MIEPAALWSIGHQVGRNGINYLAFTILALLLTPEDFGLLGLALVWINFGQIFAELGFGAAIIQRDKIDDGHLSTTFLLNLVVGVLLTLAGIGLAGPIAGLFSAPAAQPVVQLLSVTFVLRALGLTHAVLAQRRLDFRGLAGRDAAAALGGACVGIALAASGHGVYALVWQTIVSTLVGSALLWSTNPWRPRLAECSGRAVRDLWPYSSQVFLFGGFKFLAQNADKFLVTYLLGPVALGIYTLASRLVLVPTSAFTGAVGSYMFPKLAGLQDRPADAHRAFLEGMSFIARVLTPALAASAILGPELIVIVYGQEWRPASALLPMMAVIAAVSALISPAGQVMKAMGRPEWLFRWAVGFTALTVAGLAVGAPGGLMGISAGLALAHLLGLGVIHAVLRSLLGVRVPDLIRIVRAPVFASMASALLAALAVRWLPGPEWSRAGGALVVFVSAYVVGLMLAPRQKSAPAESSPPA